MYVSLYINVGIYEYVGICMYVCVHDFMGVCLPKCHFHIAHRIKVFKC